MSILPKASHRGDLRIMPAVGVTGGISTGKSTFCECLRQLLPMATFFSADQAAHVLADDPEVKKQIRAQFGGRIFSPDGDLNRAELRAIVFGDAKKKSSLERILHPRIRRQWKTEAKTHRNSPNFFFADIPLLYETGGETLCDRVVVVGCSEKVQRDRLRRRMSIEIAEATQMIASQMPLEEKIRQGDYVVWNNGKRAQLIEQAQFLVASWQTQTWEKR